MRTISVKSKPPLSSPSGRRAVEARWSKLSARLGSGEVDGFPSGWTKEPSCAIFEDPRWESDWRSKVGRRRGSDIAQLMRREKRFTTHKPLYSLCSEAWLGCHRDDSLPQVRKAPDAKRNARGYEMLYTRTRALINCQKVKSLPLRGLKRKYHSVAELYLSRTRRLTNNHGLRGHSNQDKESDYRKIVVVWIHDSHDQGFRKSTELTWEKKGIRWKVRSEW